MPAFDEAVMPARVSLLACDLDGTLVGDGGEPLPGVGEALQAVAAARVPLAVCTGRPLYSAVSRADALGVRPVFYACYHGALVVDAAGVWQRHLTVPPRTADGIAADAVGAGLSVTVYDGDERREIAPVEWDAAAGLAATHGISRLVLTGRPSTVDAAVPGLAANWGRGLRIEVVAHGIADVADARADKGDALRLIAHLLGVPLAEVVACGDAARDRTMLRAAGLAVVVGSAAGGTDGPLSDVSGVTLAPDAIGRWLHELARRLTRT